MMQDFKVRPDRFFSDVNNLTCFEIWNSLDPGECKTRTTHIGGNDAVALNDLALRVKSENAREGLVVFFSSNETISSGIDAEHGSLIANCPFQMTYDSFQFLISKFHLPQSHLKVYEEASTVFLDFGSEFGLTRNEVQQFVIQNISTTTSRYTASFSFNPINLVTVALINGLSNSEIAKITNDLVNYQHCVAFPMLLPISLLEFRVDSAVTKARDGHHEIIDIEHDTGIRTKWHPGKPCCERHAHSARDNLNLYERVDFNKATEDLTSITAKLAFVEYLCDVHLPMLDAFDRNNGRTLRFLSTGNESRFEYAAHVLTSEIERFRCSLQATRCRSIYLSKRGQVLVQTIYSLIAQKDNALGMRDNAALKKISEDQKLIALAATRDSATMRVISVITMVFLPATFTATFFSTTFFNFQPGNDSYGVVSNWLWLYFVATLGLSALILGWWYLSSRPYLVEHDGEFRELLIQTLADGSAGSAPLQTRKSSKKDSAV